MSNAPPAPDPKAVAYLRGQLARNPWHESEAIITKRAKALRLEKRNPHAEAVDHSRQREEVRAALAKVRSAAFTGNVQDLAAQLEAAPLADFPDLAAAANRLRAILSSRAKLPTLVHAPDFDADFLDIFKQVLVSPARDTALAKERALIAFNRRALRKRGNRMIGLVRRELPELYALEKDWLDSLSAHKSSTALNNALGGGLVGVIVITLAIVGVLTPELKDYKDNHKSPPPVGAIDLPVDKRPAQLRPQQSPPTQFLTQPRSQAAFVRETRGFLHTFRLLPRPNGIAGSGARPWIEFRVKEFANRDPDFLSKEHSTRVIELISNRIRGLGAELSGSGAAHSAAEDEQRIEQFRAELGELLRRERFGELLPSASPLDSRETGMRVSPSVSGSPGLGEPGGFARPRFVPMPPAPRSSREHGFRLPPVDPEDKQH